MGEHVYALVAAKRVQPSDRLALAESLVCFRKVAQADGSVCDVNEGVNIFRVRVGSSTKIIKGAIRLICKQLLDSIDL